MGFCCFIIPIPFIVALLSVFATLLLLPSGAPGILAVAAQAPVACTPERPQVNCLLDPCKTTSVAQCPLGCRADYCGGCQSHCLCRHRLDCLSSGGSCKKEFGEIIGTCINYAPPKQAGDSDAPQVTYIDVPVDAASSVEAPAEASAAPAVEVVVAEPAAASSSSVASRSVAVTLTENNGDDAAAPVQTCRMFCGPGKVCRRGRCVRANPRPPVDNSCGNNAHCSAEHYCSSGHKCVARGSCSVPADCANDPSFVHPMCVGSYTCSSEHTCGYTCSSN